MFYSITLPAKYRCSDCHDLFIDPKVEYVRKGRYYYRYEKCPTCGSVKIEDVPRILPYDVPRI